MADDYYGVLGVARDATSQDIKRAFREIARRCHPDVAGTDPVAEEQFKSARKAYETLMDPVARARYDRRGQQRKAPPPGSFFDAFYRATGERAPPPPPPGRAATGPRNPGNSVTLDDLFNDFGDFGFGQGRAGPGAAPGPVEEPRGRSAPGEDVYVDLDVPDSVAKEGGSIAAVYFRLQRADSWRPGSPDPGLVRVQDIADVRIVPGTQSGEVLRERGLGNAGPYGGAHGDLVVIVKLVRSAPSEAPAPEPVAEGTVDLSVVEALLGGRVSLDTPQGKVRLTIAPGTSSGARLRLRGRGPMGPDGQPTDWFAVTRIVVPKELDAESRRLIEEFARLNPSADDA